MIDKTTYVSYTGEIYWAKPYADHYDDGKYGKQYTVALKMSDEDYKDLRRTGAKPNRHFETGLVNFRRKDEAPRPEWGGPPKVGIENPEDGSVELFDKPIGNGTIATVTIQLYPYKAYGGGVGTRLEKILIKDLIEYNPDLSDVDGPGEDEGQVAKEGKAEAEAHNDFKKKKALKEKEEDLDDQIPF